MPDPPSKTNSHLPLAEMPETAYVHFANQASIGPIPTRFLHMALGPKICRDIKKEWERLKADARPTDTPET